MRSAINGATIMLEYGRRPGAAANVVAVPVDSLDEGTVMRLGACPPEAAYDILFDSAAVIYPPVSISDLLEGETDMGTDDGGGAGSGAVPPAVGVAPDPGGIDRVTLSARHENGAVETVRLPIPDAAQLAGLLGSHPADGDAATPPTTDADGNGDR